MYLYNRLTSTLIFIGRYPINWDLKVGSGISVCTAIMHKAIPIMIEVGCYDTLSDGLVLKVFVFTVPVG